ncbi:MAG: hypothetical protein U1G07_19510 [Verrucomicrobiota bacterium]
MSHQDSTSRPGGVPDDPASAEERLGQTLGLIHRILARIDDPSRSADVQLAFRRAAGLLEAARQAYEGSGAPLPSAPGGSQRVATEVDPEIAAVIAAAVSVLFNRPYRLVSVQPIVTPVPHLNVWALEGRTQIFQSHKIR